MKPFLPITTAGAAPAEEGAVMGIVEDSAPYL
jgi:hypothetical protein